MAKNKGKKQRRKNNRWFAVVLGSMLIMMAFVFSLRSLSSPYSTEAQQQETLESDWGNSTLASKYKNLFGIKAFGNEEKVNLETKEYINEEWITIQGDFRVYSSWEQSMDDHTALFVNGVDWNPALYANVITATNYIEAAHALQAAGYATDPTYADKIIHVIETYQLNQYDQ